MRLRASAALFPVDPRPESYSPFVKKPTHRPRIILGLALVVLIGVGFSAKPVYRAGKGWRSRQLARQAQALMTAEKWEEASRKARAAFQLKPNEPETIRAAGRLESLSGRHANALGFWKQLEELKARLPADRLNQAEDMLRTGSVIAAEEGVKALLASEPKNAAYLRLAARIAATKRQLDKSIEYAQQSTDSDPANVEGRLLLALLQSQSTRPELRAAGVQSMLQISRGKDKYGLEALMMLSTRKEVPAADQEKLLPLIKEHPMANETQKLQALELEIQLRPENREATLDRVMAESQGASPEAQRALGVWLNARKEYERAMKVISLEQGLKRKDMFLVHLDALAALDRWPAIEQILEGKQVPLDEVYKELFLARSLMEQGALSKADLHWRRAHLAAAPSPEQVWFVGNYAEKIGQTDQAELAFRSLTSNASVARAAYEALLRLTEKQRDAGKSRDILNAMHERWPADAAIANDYAYLSLLQGMEVEACLKTAQRLVEKAPSSLPHRTTLALAYYRLNQPGPALAVYSRIVVPWDQVAGSQRIVYAAVLALNGQKAEAKAQLGSIRKETLRAEELALMVKAVGE